MTADYSIIMTTVADIADARLIIDALLTERLASGIQVLPIDSFYIWKGERREETERLLLIKCPSARFDAVKKLILGLHKYELPEIIQVPITGGLDRYLGWLDDPNVQ